MSPPLAVQEVEKPKINVLISGYESGDKSHSHNLSSTASVFNFGTHLSLTSEVIDQEKPSKPVRENTVLTVTIYCRQIHLVIDESSSDDLPLDLPFINKFFNNVPTLGLSFLDQNDTIFRDNIYSDDLSFLDSGHEDFCSSLRT